MNVKVGFWKLVQTGCTDGFFVFEELVAAANAEMREKQRDKIIKN
jgi:hypothetical protein